MSRTGNHPQAEGAADLVTRLAAAEKALSARDKTIRVLMQRVQARQANKGSALALLGQNADLQEVVARKTLELEERTVQLEASLKELRGKTAFLEALVNSSQEGILVVNDQGKKAIQNQQFNRLLKIPSEIAEEADDARRLQYVTDSAKNPGKFQQKVLHLYSHRDETSRDEVEFKNGSVMDRYSAPVLDENGNYYGRIWAFRDITDQKRMQREVEETQRQLVLASRQAGMAEVATSVLHNVGNVLNSVNVSTAAILDQVKKSRFANVARVAGLLEQHAGDLAQFITVDPTGRETPAYLRRLGNYLEREQQTLLKEIELIQRHVEHIKEIVAMQQGYAKCFGIVEKVQVPDMVEDALRINAGALARHDVRVVRDYNLTISEIAVEKHKVLQILVNLIRNAKDACHEGSCREKLLTIRLTNRGDRVRIEVVDNGVGIPKENLKRIFSFGFTTRKGGHGFGLHSAALAAAEMGARLAANSEGPQMGATFTLELPLQPPKASL